ncbi:MAG: hypothetical protein WB696_04790 [Chthoniobacterales bacterium]
MREGQEFFVSGDAAVPRRNDGTKAISVADPEPQSPLFAIIPQRNLPANDTNATAISDYCVPIAPR